MQRTRNYLILFLFSFCGLTFGQSNGHKPPVFTKADTLRGMLTPLRTCYDVTYYHLDVKVDTLTKSISGSNTIQFRVVSDFDRMQIDLTPDMEIERIVYGDDSLPFEREFGAVFIRFPETMEQGSEQEITVFYSGTPKEAKHPPWEGGFIWSHDKEGNVWVAVTAEGDGAYLWWPNKEHPSDEPDSMLISVTIPTGMMDVSNGRLRSKTDLSNNWTRWDWFVSYPINNYNVTLNIGKYAHFDDVYVSRDGDRLTLDYYVLPDHLAEAKEQFKQVKPMLACFEKWFGKYPFYRDGYKLVEAPYPGMEHQSCIAYGNHYRDGYLGHASSEIGLSFDYIIVHESAHEWWGNSVTAKDIADMWIHEGCATYAEALFVECQHGYEAGLAFLHGKRQSVMNDRPIIGYYNVNNMGSGDMYNKGALMLNTLRHVINNDSLWLETLRGIATEFRRQTVTTDDMVEYVNEKTGEDYSYLFDQYLKYPDIPELDVTLIKQGQKVRIKYRWKTDVEDFKMPIKVTTSKGKYEFIYPTNSWQTTELQHIQPEDFRVAEDKFFVKVNLRTAYLQEADSKTNGPR